MAKFFKYPFAASGDKITIPDPVQGSGEVSYVEGFGFDYERDQTSDALAKAVPRDQTNELFYQVTLALQQYQTNGFPDFITTADNGGTPYSYGLSAFVRYDDGGGYAVYESIVSSNTSLPTDTTKWRRLAAASSFFSGVGMDYHLSTLPDGWIWADGNTIGNAVSGATNRANADCEKLFLGLWASQPNSILPIFDSSGAVSSRGISAAADWSAGKRLTVPDKRGRVSAGRDDMGGSAANRLTGYRQGVVGVSLGASGGEEKHTPTIAEMAAHTHKYTRDGGFPGSIQEQAGFRNQATPDTTSTGGGQAFNIVQPTLITNYIIKL